MKINIKYKNGNQETVEATNFTACEVCLCYYVGNILTGHSVTIMMKEIDDFSVIDEKPLF